MKVKAYVPDWPGTKQHGTETARIISSVCEVEILDDPNDYFTQQWNKAVAGFLASDADILFITVADVWPPENLEEMFKVMLSYFENNTIGIYAPEVRWTGQKLFRHKLKEIAPNVYDVPMPEMLCWAIHRDVVLAMPFIDPLVNKYGWGIDYLAVATARKLGLRAICDFNFCAKHTKGLGYSGEEAELQFNGWLTTLDPETRKGIAEVWHERQAVGVRLTKKIIGGTPALREKFYNGLINNQDFIEVEHGIPLGYDAWLAATYDVKDVCFLQEFLPEEALAAMKANGVDNLVWLIPTDPASWGPDAPNIWHWRHPVWKNLNLTEWFGVPVVWMLPKEY